MAPDPPSTILLDVDGTLVDSNYQHAIAWHRAFREHGYRAAIWEIHRHVGMGGGQFVAALLGEEAENAPVRACSYPWIFGSVRPCSCLFGLAR
jgi:beta-phosphoglucomutase-like phosphatase (HAD superfamily)